MSPLNDLHGKVPPPPVHVVALGFNGPWEVQTMKVRLATCRDRNVADYIAALWNLMPAVPDGYDADYALTAEESAKEVRKEVLVRPNKFRRRKAGKSVQVMP